MKDYASLRKKNHASRSIAIIMVVLLVIEMCSLTVLFSRVSGFFENNSDYVISLTEGAENSVLKKVDTANTGFIVPTYVADPDTHFIEPEDKINEKDIGFSTYDEDQVWTTDTDIEVFHLTYDKDKEQLTVISQNDSKVFAPGTAETYKFTVSNTGSCPLKYLVYLEAWIDAKDPQGNDLWIPLFSRFHNEEGTFFSNTYTDSEWHDYPHIDKTGEINSLSTGSLRNYLVDWEWPFERFDGEGLEANDEYDTMLGNLAAAGSDLRAYIRIKTVAWAECPEPTVPSETVEPTDATEATEATEAPTLAPTEAPTVKPTEAPTLAPTEKPTEAPTLAPTEKPTEAPTLAPTEKPTEAPTLAPTEKPTVKPTEPAPTTEPTGPAPTAEPTGPAPTTEPTGEPGTEPTVAPTEAPTSVIAPTQVSTVAPTTPGTPVTPKTGDLTNNILWIVLAICALAALIVLFIIYRKVKKREKADN